MSERVSWDEATPEERASALAAVRARFAPSTPSVDRMREEGDATQPPNRNALDRGYRAVAGFVTEGVARAVNPILHTLTEPAVTATRIAQEGSLRPIIEARSPVSSSLPVSRAAAAAVVPQTPMEAGIMLGTGAAGKALKGAGQVVQAGGRILGSAAGGEAGSQLEGGATGRGAAWGAGLGGLGEGVGVVGSKIARSLPGAKTRIAEKDARALGQLLERESSGLPGARTSADLHAMASGGGRATLGARKEKGIQAIEKELNGQLLDVPAIGESPMTLRDANRVLSEVGARAFSKNPLDRTILGVDQRKLYGTIETQIEQGLKDAHRRAIIMRHVLSRQAEETARPKLALPARSKPGVTGPARTFEQGPMWEEGARIPRAPGAKESPRDAAVELLRHVESEKNPWVNVGGYPARPPIVIETSANRARQVPGAPPSRMQHRPAESTVPERMPDVPAGRGADAAFIKIQDEYKQGITLLRNLLERSDAFRTGPKGVELNTPAIQKMLTNPKTRAALTNKLGADGFDRVVEVLTRGGGLGTQDILAAGQGGFGNLAGQMFRGRNTGASAPFLAAGMAALPNVGSRYAGARPYALTTGQQTALDLLMAKIGAGLGATEAAQ